MKKALSFRKPETSYNLKQSDNNIKKLNLFKLNNDNKFLNSLTKTKNIFKRAFANNLGKIIVFSILLCIILLLISYDIPIDGSYKEDSNFGDKILSVVNVIIIGIILAGAIAIFSTETNITNNDNNIKDKLNCKLDIIKDTFNLEYVYNSIDNDDDNLNQLHNLYSYNTINYNNNKKKKKIILQYLLNKLYNCNCENDIYLQAYINLLKYIKNLEINNYTSIYEIEQDINKNFTKLSKFIKDENIKLSQNINLIKEYYNDPINKEPIELFLNKHNITLLEANELILTLDNIFIEKIFDFLKIQCLNISNNCS